MVGICVVVFLGFTGVLGLCDCIYVSAVLGFRFLGRIFLVFWCALGWVVGLLCLELRGFWWVLGDLGFLVFRLDGFLVVWLCFRVVWCYVSVCVWVLAGEFGFGFCVWFCVWFCGFWVPGCAFGCFVVFCGFVF